MQSTSDYQACPHVDRIDGPASPDGFVDVYLRPPATADEFLRWLVTSGARVEHFERLSRDFLGYEVKQTLLLHANALNADHFGRLAAMLRARGYRFISLSEALIDPAYALPEAQSPRGLSWLHRWMLAKGLPVREEPREPAWIGAATQGPK